MVSKSVKQLVSVSLFTVVALVLGTGCGKEQVSPRWPSATEMTEAELDAIDAAMADEPKYQAALAEAQALVSDELANEPRSVRRPRVGINQLARVYQRMVATGNPNASAVASRLNTMITNYCNAPKVIWKPNCYARKK